MSISVRVVGVLLTGLLALVGVPLGTAVAADPTPAVLSFTAVTNPTPLDDGAVDVSVSDGAGTAATGAVSVDIVKDDGTPTTIPSWSVDLVAGSARVVLPAAPPSGYRAVVTYAGDAAVGAGTAKFWFNISPVPSTLTARLASTPTPTAAGAVEVDWRPTAPEDARYGDPTGSLEITIWRANGVRAHRGTYRPPSGAFPATVPLPTLLPGSYDVWLSGDPDAVFNGGGTRIIRLLVGRVAQTVTTAWRPLPTPTSAGELRVRGVAAGVGYSTGLFTIQIKNAAGRTVKTASAKPSRTTGIAAFAVPRLPAGTYTLAVQNPGDTYLVRQRIEQKVVIRR